ncbi:elongation of very long chain fatty acids protein 3 isoform X3 [Chelonia mydas]|uniref:elongation of very long chain fatty acids protein 3 isoform X3 n=1 Tax=Chelonia mydas TaxID=8469 RepID=UPI001CA9C436|nr:elongation of very long chain fatty acids protein 3 isoform X3 [Chelonia mydas]
MELLGANLSALPRPQEYDFERRFDELQAIQWMRENWVQCSLQCQDRQEASLSTPAALLTRSRRRRKSFSFALAYVLLIFGGQHVMKQRRGYDLRKPLVLWSLSLALFSIIGTLRTWGYMGFVLSTSGFKRSVCDPGFYNGPVSKFWAYMFVLSKVPELGDTVFIILRKQRLIFLHWYHHVTVLLYTCCSAADFHCTSACDLFQIPCLDGNAGREFTPYWRVLSSCLCTDLCLGEARSRNPSPWDLHPDTAKGFW